MRKKPWPIIILGFLHITAPLFNIFLGGMRRGFSFSETLQKAFDFEVLWYNSFSLVLPFIAGLAILACKKWSFFVYLASMLSLFLLNISTLLNNQVEIGALSFLTLFFGNLLVVTYFLIPAVRKIYFNRQLRWWENQTRYHADYSCECFTSDESKSSSAHVKNISVDGLYLLSEKKLVSKLNLKIKIKFDEEQTEVRGEAILHNVQSGGFGFKIDHTNESRKTFKNIIAKLESEGKRATNLPNIQEDTLTYWVSTLLKTGKGLIP